MAVTSQVQPALGRALRAAREERRLSLQEVAEASAVSASFLSLVENGKSDITLGRLTRLIECYGVSISDLIPHPEPIQPDIVRAGEGTLVRSSSEGIDCRLLTPDMHRAMMPMLLHFAPGAELEEPGHHPGEEWIYVVSGSLKLTVEGSEARVLQQGDSAYYLADRPHRFANGSRRRPLTAICVDTPPPL